MKRLFKLFLIVGLCLSLVGCSNTKKEPQPKDTVASMLDCYKAKEFDKLSSFSKNGDLLNEEDFELTDIPEDQKEFQELVFDKMSDIDYTIDGETIDGDNAIVKVTITANNVGAQLTKGVGEAMSKAFELAFAGLSQEEIEKQTMEAMFAPLKECEKNFTNTVDVKLEKADGKWYICDDNEAMANAISGGLLEFAATLEETE